MTGVKAFFYRIRFVVAAIVAAVLPIVVTGVVLLGIAEQALIEEKKQKLIAITQQLDYALPNDFDTILREGGAAGRNREAQIAYLNKVLAPVTDKIAQAHPDVGVGYYSAALDAILTYSPAQEMHHVGESIRPTHPGRDVLKTGQTEVAIGQFVRGYIMNAMTPLVRHGRIVGYAWANELMANIDVQLAGMRKGIYAILAVGSIVAAAVSGLLVNRLEAILGEIKTGLRRLSRDLSFRLRRLPGEAGEIAHAINRLAGDLQASRTHTENIIQSMDECLIALDQNGTITAWNRAAGRLTGIDAQSAVGRPHAELSGGAAVLMQVLLDTLHTGEGRKDDEIVYPLASGERLLLRVTTSVLRNPAKEVTGAIAVFEDRTAYKEMEARLEQAKRLAVIGELAAGIAHEVRNPLTSIKAFTQLIEEELPPGHDSREYTSIIVEEVERLNRFADELLLFSRPQEEGNQPVCVETVLEQTVKLMEPAAAKRGVRLARLAAEGMPLVSASDKLLKQVFLNLLLNAVQASHPGGSVRIAATADSQEVAVAVTNDGPPIREAHLAAIFEPFFTTKKTGTGLGLSISQRIVNAYGGTITAANVEGGVCFTVKLPVKREGEMP